MITVVGCRVAKSKWSQSNDEIVRYGKMPPQSEFRSCPNRLQKQEEGLVCGAGNFLSVTSAKSTSGMQHLITYWRQPRSTAARRQSTMFWVASCPCSQHSALQHANGMAFVSIGGNLPQLQPAVLHRYYSHLGEKR